MLTTEARGLELLTDRQRELLDWVRQGKTNWEIAVIMECSENTVKTQLQRIFRKVGVHSRCAAVDWLRDHISF